MIMRLLVASGSAILRLRGAPDWNGIRHGLVDALSWACSTRCTQQLGGFSVGKSDPKMGNVAASFPGIKRVAVCPVDRR